MGDLNEINVKEIFDFAMVQEKWAEDFYYRIADKLHDDEQKKLFIFLAIQERKHFEDFREMAGKITLLRKQESKAEHISALTQHLHNAHLTRDKLAHRLSVLTDMAKIYEFAMDLELDTMLFYTEIRELFQINEQGFVTEIIEEERRHFQRLFQLKKAKGL